MTSINTYYIGKEELASFIQDEKIKNSSSLLIQIFSAINTKTFISELLAELILLLPDAMIIGSTTDGEIMDGKVTSGKVVLSFTQFEHTTLKVAAVEHKINGYHSGQYLAKELISNDTKLLIAFADGMQTNGDEFLNGISSINENVIVSGGFAGDNFEFIKTFVFIKDSIIEHGAVGVSLNSKQLQVHVDHSFNWHPIGKELTVTKAEGNRVYTIDGKSTVDIYAHYLGENIRESLPGIGIEFPLIVSRNGLELARSMLSKENDGSLNMAGSLYNGEKVQIGFGSSHGILEKSEKILESTSRKPSEAIFVYSCTARRHFMGDEIGSEILPLQSIAPVSGFFTYGEFFSSHKKELLNQTMTLVSLSESDTVHKIKKAKSQHEANSYSISFDALTHLVNITREELLESNKLSKQLRERMEMAVGGSKTSVLDWDFDDNSMYISPSWKKMLGYKDDELENSTRTWKKLTHINDLMSVLKQLKKSKKEKVKTFENNHRLKHKDGHWVWVLGRAQILYDENGKALRMVGTHTDITEEKELQLKYFYQSQMIDQINDSVTTTDLRGNIVTWNLGSEKTFGYTASEVIGKNISMLYQEKDIPSLMEYIPVLMETGVYNGDLYLVKKSKELIAISFSLSLLRDENRYPIGIVGINKDITKRKQAEDELFEQKSILHYQAHHDALTGLPNRALFFDRLEQGIIKAKRHSEGLALFFIDLDKFKHINDSLGHSTGDSVLKTISKRLEGIVRKEDTVARLSGDEFTIIIEELKHPEDASKLAEKILKTLQEPIHINMHKLYVSGSVGISMYPEDAEEAQDLLKYADTAMYKAKEEGRDNYQFYSPDMTEFAMKRIVMKTCLRQALDDEEFFIHYQPQINSCSGKLVGVEVLIRWQHPTMGLLSPDKFIPLAEDTGMIVEVDRWVMHTSMKQVSDWYKEGLQPGVLGLNLSIKQLESSDFIALLKESIKRYDFKAEWLELEITEGQMMTKPDEVISKLHEINTLGVGISIDDFGTGYSSLSLLKRLPIHRLKIDQSFIQDIPNDEEDVAIVQAIIAMANSLSLELVAEGVETLEQKEFLIENGCINMQGYYFSKPVPREEMRNILLDGFCIIPE